MFEKYDPNKDYDGRGVNQGFLAKGMTVRFADGERGTVIIAGSERSLVQYSAPAGSGASYYREWFRNEVLEIETREGE
jgi:hypothetical protein